MKKIGITGGIGSGKSVVSNLFTLEGIPVYRADDESKRLTDTSLVIREKLTALIDDSIYSNDKLDRQRLATLIFDDEALLKKVNGIIHPEVKRDFRQWVEKQVSDCCALESAILFESNFEQEVDAILLVCAPVELRLKRVQLRDGVSEAEVLKRMNRQLPDEIKRQKADFVIINDDLQPLIPQVELFIQSQNIPQLKPETTNEARAEAACGLCRARRSSFYEVKKN